LGDLFRDTGLGFPNGTGGLEMGLSATFVRFNRDGLFPDDSSQEAGPPRIGSYELTEEERQAVIAENARRGNLALIQERNSGTHRPGARRKSES